MNVVRKIVVGIAGVVVVALALELVAPKAVHAVVSTLVTVSNTTAQPVPTMAVDTRNVNVVNTPNVNVNSLPAVQLSGTPSVNIASPLSIGGNVSATIANTSANPGVALDEAHAASQIVTMECFTRSYGTAYPCLSVSTAGAVGSQYTVPSGENLVITSIQFDPGEPASGLLFVQLLADGGNQAVTWPVSNASVSQLQFPGSGIVYGGGSTLAINMLASVNAVASASDVLVVELHGYLTPQ